MFFPGKLLLPSWVAGQIANLQQEEKKKLENAINIKDFFLPLQLEDRKDGKIHRN